eukprot:11282576-Ditylum_brightwellii.AAC.1
MDRPFNCSRPCKVNGACAFKGCTQDKFKARMAQHFNDVSRLMSSTKLTLPEDDKQNSDTFAKNLPIISLKTQHLNFSAKILALIYHGKEIPCH